MLKEKMPSSTVCQTLSVVGLRKHSLPMVPWSTYCSAIGNAEKIANEIKAVAGIAVPAQVDALNAKAVQADLYDLISKNNHLDISFNRINNKSIQNIPLADKDLEDFVRSINIAMRTQFITNIGAARIMINSDPGSSFRSLQCQVASAILTWEVLVLGVPQWKPDQRSWCRSLPHMGFGW